MLRPVFLKKFDGYGKEADSKFIWEQLRLTKNNYDILLFENDRIVKLCIPHSDEFYHRFSSEEWNDVIRFIESNFSNQGS